MTIARDSKLARAFRIARIGDGCPDFRAQGYVAPLYNGESYARAGDGQGHAMHALTIARGMVEAPAPIYSGMPGPRYPETDSAFRDTVAAHDVSAARIEHKGWYCNPESESWRDGSGLCWGVVCQLPGRKGLARYVAGYQFGGVDGGPTLDLTTVYESESTGWHGDTPDSLMDAARAADSLAESAAEKEKEYQTAWRAGSDWAGEKETIETTRQETLALLQQNRESGGSRDLPAIHATICKAVCDARGRIVAARERMAALASGDSDYLIFYPSDDLKAACCEGAGLDLFPGDSV